MSCGTYVGDERASADSMKAELVLQADWEERLLDCRCVGRLPSLRARHHQSLVEWSVRLAASSENPGQECWKMSHDHRPETDM